MATISWAEQADYIAGLEEQGKLVSAGWYDFGPVDDQDVEKLIDIHTASLSKLQTLGPELERALNSGEDNISRDNTQYAFHLVRELIQSREADLELLHTWKRESVHQHPEFGRAIAIKEKAASEQSEKLRQALRSVH